MPLTKQQARDVSLLVELGGYDRDDAIMQVVMPKTKVRAPTMDDWRKMKEREKKCLK